MKHKWTVVILIAGREMARSKPLPQSEIRAWIDEKKATYRKLLDDKPWVIYRETASQMQSAKAKTKPETDA